MTVVMLENSNSTLLTINLLCAKLFYTENYLNSHAQELVKKTKNTEYIHNFKDILHFQAVIFNYLSPFLPVTPFPSVYFKYWKTIPLKPTSLQVGCMDKLKGS